MSHPASNQQGFTLLELMIAMVVASILGLAMYAFQQSQTRLSVTQESLAKTQQNARAAMHFLVREIREAGCDSSGKLFEKDPAVTEADADSITFSRDLNDNESLADEDEDITYLRNAQGNLVRRDNNTGQSYEVAEDFDALNFVYYDEDGNRIANADLSDNLRNIRAVLVTVVARSGDALPGAMASIPDTRTYENVEAGGADAEDTDTLLEANDDLRRIQLATRIRLRNTP
ncbi:MAG: prepilin-type N-terminal cleavage/methylation domain-containing protein [Desulfosudaceae bacterium]